MLTPHRYVIEASRDTKKTLYVVAGFYVLVGFILAVVSAVNGDRLGTFLGFLIISGALATAALIRAVLRIGLRVSAMSDNLDDIRRRLESLAATMARLTETANQKSSVSPTDGNAISAMGDSGSPATGDDARAISAPPSPTVDLMTGAGFDADLLTAATLDRSVFPRLVTLLEREPAGGPAMQVEIAAAREEARHAGVARTSLFKPVVQGTSGEAAWSAETVARSVSAVAEAVATSNLMREWTVALVERDLPRARRILLTLADTADEQEVERLNGELAELGERTEDELRLEFAECARQRDVEAMLVVADRIRELLPDRPIAEECSRIEAALLNRDTQTAAV